MFKTLFKAAVALGVGALMVYVWWLSNTGAEPDAAVAPLSAIAGAVLVGASFLRGDGSRFDLSMTNALRVVSVGAFLQSGWYWLESVEDVSERAQWIGGGMMLVGVLVAAWLIWDHYKGAV